MFLYICSYCCIQIYCRLLLYTIVYYACMYACMYVCMYVCMYTCTCTALYRRNVVSLCTLSTAVFSVFLELQGDCSDQITLICRHSDNGVAPLWIHNGTVEIGDPLGTAFPGAVYSVLTKTEHTATITGVDSVRALDGHVIQCAYDYLGNLIKSNTVQFSFIPPGQS